MRTIRSACSSVRRAHVPSLPGRRRTRRRRECSTRERGPVAGLVRFDWAALSWFEEDEPIYGHPPATPPTRVDALRSHRHVTVEFDGAVLADTHSPVLLFETGLPTRYYIDRTDVAFEHLEPSDTQSLCPYKGVTSGYWSVRVGDTLHTDMAWTYNTPPLPAVAPPIANMIAFYNEKLDISVDGVELPPARTRTFFLSIRGDRFAAPGLTSVVGDGQRHIDVAAGGVRIWADLMRLVRQRHGRLMVDVGQHDLQLDRQGKAAGVIAAE